MDWTRFRVREKKNHMNKQEIALVMFEPDQRIDHEHNRSDGDFETKKINKIFKHNYNKLMDIVCNK